jgi:hypothetical protein
MTDIAISHTYGLATQNVPSDTGKNLKMAKIIQNYPKYRFLVNLLKITAKNSPIFIIPCVMG